MVRAPSTTKTKGGEPCLALPFSFPTFAVLGVLTTLGELRVYAFPTSDPTPRQAGFPSCYSTVTDFARLRGWSTLHPRFTAM